MTVSADIMDSSSTESDDEEFIKERATSKNSVKSRDSGGSRKWSEKFGTLEDFDRSSRGNAETDDDYHGDLNYEAWLTADEVRMCVCVCDDMNGFFYIATTSRLYKPQSVMKFQFLMRSQ